MFLRKKGQRIYLLHSYRDGRGQVCHRRLGHFADRASLERQLADLHTSCPEFGGEALSKLRTQAEDLLVDFKARSVGGAERIRRATRALLTLLAEQDAETLTEVADELQTLQARLGPTERAQAPGATEQVWDLGETDQSKVQGATEQAQELGATTEPSQEETEESLRSQARAARSRLSPRRRRMDPTEPTALPYVEATHRLAEYLVTQGRLLESAEVFEQLVCSTSKTQLAYGAVLHKLGRRQEALEQYSRVPRAFAYRHYNAASACWEEGCPEAALDHLLRGFMRDPEVVEALKRHERRNPDRQGGEYWAMFGDLWSSGGRSFMLNVCSQLLVRWRRRQAQDRGVVARNLIPVRSREWFLAKVLADPKN